MAYCSKRFRFLVYCLVFLLETDGKPIEEQISDKHSRKENKEHQKRGIGTYGNDYGPPEQVASNVLKFTQKYNIPPIFPDPWQLSELSPGYENSWSSFDFGHSPSSYPSYPSYPNFPSHPSYPNSHIYPNYPSINPSFDHDGPTFVIPATSSSTTQKTTGVSLSPGLHTNVLNITSDSGTGIDPGLLPSTTDDSNTKVYGLGTVEEVQTEKYVKSFG